MHLTGFAVGAVFYCLSLTPSLLPRAWFLQGVVSGITAAMGYAVGALVPDRLFGAAHPPDRLVGRCWSAAPVAGTVFVLLGTRWQKDLRRRLGMEALDTSYTFRMVLISLATFAVAAADRPRACGSPSAGWPCCSAGSRRSRSRTAPVSWSWRCSPSASWTAW